MVSAAMLLPHRVRARLAAFALLLPALAVAEAPSLFLEADLEAPRGHVQAQVLYTLRFHQAIDVRELALHPPAARLAELRRVGEDRIGELTRDGRRYRVTERRYAVFPYASGELVLAGGHATGLVAASGTREAVRIEAPPVMLAVRPIPTHAGEGAWLPARALALAERWEPGPETARVGEALRRILRIEGVGVDAAQLPALDFAAPGFTVHPEPPRLQTRVEEGLVVGIREQGYRVVPLRPGPLHLPELALPWWDVLADRPRTAALDARMLAVAPAAAPQPWGAEGSEPSPEATREVPGPTDGTSPDEPRAPAWLVATIGALLTLAPAVALVRRRMRPSSLRVLRRACRHNDPHAARRALLAWAAGRWPVPPRSLGALAGRLPDPGMRAAVLALDRHLYGPVGAAWDRRALAGFPGPPAMRRLVRPKALPPLHSR